MHSPRPALSGPAHVFLHVLVVVIGWGIFGWGWWTVGFEQSPHPAVIASLILVTLIVAPLVTLYWVLHNRGIYLRKGPRLGVRSATEIYKQDWAGRLVHAKFDELRHSQLVIINSTPEDKYFLTPADSLNTKSAPS